MLLLFNLFKWGTNVEIIAPKKLKDKYKSHLGEILRILNQKH